MEIDATMQIGPPVRSGRTDGAGPAATRTDAIDRPGRRHVQRGLRHMLRDVGHLIRAELAELRAAGDGDRETIATVRSAFHAFRDQVQAAYHDAGGGGSFDREALQEGLREAMVAFTEVLRGLNGADGEPPAVVPAPAPAPDRVVEPQPAPDAAMVGVLLDAAV